MNLVLLNESDFTSTDRVTLTDRRFHHIKNVHKVSLGDTLRVGLLDGFLGEAVVEAISEHEVLLRVNLTEPPVPALPATLILALPRPKMLKRILETVAAMGVKEIYLINSYRVDKSYWSTPWLKPEKVDELFRLGLEQSGDTRLPKLHLRKRFKPFVEDELPAIAADTRALIAHPYNASTCPAAKDEPTTLAIGPEGGFIAYEVEKLEAIGFTAFHLGRRILRVETAIPATLSRLFPAY